MKYLKMLFSRFFVGMLLMFAQAALVFVVAYYYNARYAAFAVVNSVISVFTFFVIINKKECAEFKVPWVFIITLLPLFGIGIYVMFANPRTTKEYAYRLSANDYVMGKYLKMSDGQKEEVESFLGEYAGVENYLERTSYTHGYLNSRVTYFKSGEEFFADLKAQLAVAEKFIFMEYFIIDYGEIWDGILKILQEKAANGVDVRVVYDDIGTVGKLRGNYYKTLRKAGIKCHKFNPFRPIVSGIYNNRDHRKITVIDGKTGYTGGVNIADEYANLISPHGHWKDAAIKIEGSAVGNLTKLFLQAYDLAADEISDYKKFFPAEYESFEGGGYVHPFGDGPKPYYRELVGENNYINLLNRAQKYAYITTPYLILDYGFTNALRAAALRGVDVRIITPHVADKKIVFNMTRSSYPHLLSAGVKIYEYTKGFIHAKTFVSDDVAAFVGTINLDYRSLVHHYECGAVLYKAPCIKDIKEDFEETVAVSQRVTPENFKMNKLVALVNSILSIFSPML